MNIDVLRPHLKTPVAAAHQYPNNECARHQLKYIASINSVQLRNWNPMNRANHFSWLGSTVWWNLHFASHNNARIVPRLLGLIYPSNNWQYHDIRATCRGGRSSTPAQTLPSCLCTQSYRLQVPVGRYLDRPIAKYATYLFAPQTQWHD